MLFFSALLLTVCGALAYPETYTSCGVDHTVSASPTKIVTMNQGATEFMLALGLANQMAGTAYLDDAIWPQYATQYAQIPVLSSGYPTESEIMAVNPDFIVASYNSAFREVYETTPKVKGIFSAATIGGPCTGVYGNDVKTTCRPDLHSKNIGTFLMVDACEDTSLRPDTVTEAILYTEMRTMGRIFNKGAHVETLITDMKADFAYARSQVSTSMSSANGQLKAVWLDCVGRCCKDANGDPDPTQVFVGGGAGAPGMIMTEAGMVNAFKDKDANWVCVSITEVVAANPDVMIIVDASWDTALSKLEYLYNHSSFCDLDVMKGARHIHIPFSATTLSPRSGPACKDLAIAALHVRTGATTPVGESGVSSFDAQVFKQTTKNLKCTLEYDKIMYETTVLTDGLPQDVTSGLPQSKNSILPCVLAYLVFICFSA